MTSRLRLENLVFWTHLGVGDAERAVPQEISLDLDLEVDTARAAESDSVVDTVDYIEVVERVGALVRASENRLVERLAARIADLVLSDARVSRVQVVLRKRAASLPGAAARAGIVLVRP
ncbi:MAG: dihydroneopterin aldolase [bacterium]